MAVLLVAVFAAAQPAAAQSVTLVPNASRYAGTSSRGYNSDFGSAGTVQLNGPVALAFDLAGRLLVADRDNNCIRRIDATTQRLTTTVAGLTVSGSGDTCNAVSNATPTPAQGLLAPLGVTTDGSPNIFISDTGHNCVRELVSGTSGTANLVTVAGTCGAATTASATPVPTALVTDSSGNLYIVLRDTSDSIYQVLRHGAGTSAGNVCLVAGAPGSNGVAQCPDITAPPALLTPSGIAFDGVGALYIADTGNNCVRKLQNGVFSTVLGTCGSSASTLLAPTSIAFSQSGEMLVSLSNGNQVIRYTQATGATSVIVGNPNGAAGPYDATQDGAAGVAVPLNAPAGLAYDASNNLYIADAGNNIVREMSNGNLFPQTAVGQGSAQQLLTFQVNTASTLAITMGQDYSIVPGSDSCSGAHTPAGGGALPAYCSIGVIFTPTLPGNRFSPITLTNTAVSPSASVVAGLQGNGLGPQGQLFPGQASTVASGLGSILDLSRDSSDRLFALGSPSAGAPPVIVRYPVGGGVPTTIVPAGTLQQPQAFGSDAAGNWYVADLTGSSTSGPSIQRYATDGMVNRDYITNLVAPRALEVDGFGNLVVVEQGTRNDVVKIYAGGARSVIAGGGTQPPAEGASATQVKLTQPTGVALGPNGTVYITDAGAHYLFSVDTAGIFHIVAGNGTATPNSSNTALGQSLINPVDVEADAAGDLYIVDAGTNSVYTLFSAAPANNVRRIFGTAQGTPGNTGDGKPSDQAALNNPETVTVTPDGVVFIGDSGNNAIRSATFPPSTLDFGTVAVQSTTTQTQAYWNGGNYVLVRAGDPALTGSSYFSNSTSGTTCGAAVAPGLLCNLYFTFQPLATGTYTATALVNSSTPSTPQTIHLTGTVVPQVIGGFVATPEVETYGGPYVGAVSVATNGGAVPNGTLTFTINGTVTCTVTGNILGTVDCTLPNGTGLGVPGSPYPVVVTFVDAAGNYPPQSTSTTLTVLPYPLTETVNSKSRVYLQPNPSLDGAPNGTLNGVFGNSFTVTYGFNQPITTSTPPGTYAGAIVATITPVGSTNVANYAITNVPGNFVITRATLPGFGAGTETEAYGGVYTGTASYTAPASGAAPTGTVTFSNGAQVLCTTAISTATICTLPGGTGLSVGTYTITVTYSGDSNYAGTTATTTLTVTPVPLTVRVANQTKSFGAAVPNLNGSATVTGLVNGDKVGSTILLTYATTVTASTPIGTYPGAITVTVGGSAADNYTITNQPGSFLVTGIPTTTTIATSGTPAGAGVSVTFSATVTSDNGIPVGSVVFTSDGVTIGTSTLDATGATTFTTSTLATGTHIIAATYGGNANFASSSASLSQVVTLPSGAFKVSATPDTQLIRAPGNTTYQVTVTSLNGFAGPVSLTCAGLPADASCNLSPAVVTLTANGSASATLTTTTTNADAQVSQNRTPSGIRPNWSGTFAITAAAAFPLQLSGLGLLAAGIRRRRPGRKQTRILLLLLLTVGLLGLAGCGCPNTAFHTYPITITGTSVNGGPAPASTTVYLSVGLPLY